MHLLAIGDRGLHEQAGLGLLRIGPRKDVGLLASLRGAWVQEDIPGHRDRAPTIARVAVQDAVRVEEKQPLIAPASG